MLHDSKKWSQGNDPMIKIMVADTLHIFSLIETFTYIIVCYNLVTKYVLCYINI